jgi:hypothetical protein
MLVGDLLEALGFGGARPTGVSRVQEAAWLKVHVGFSLGTQKGSVEVVARPRNQTIKKSAQNQLVPF